MGRLALEASVSLTRLDCFFYNESTPSANAKEKKGGVCGTEALLNGLGLLCPLAALAGFSLFLSRRAAISLSLAPALACAWVALLLTLGGVLGVLWYSAVLLWMVGILLLFLEGWLRRKTLRGLFSASTLFLLLSCLYGAVRLHGVKLLHHDNFSHWALMTDHLLKYDQLPGLGDALITFPSYPPAAAVLIYFFARLSGSGEGVMAFGQAVWIFCCGATLFSFVDKRKPLAYGILCVSFIAMLIANVFLDELLVDTLLPMAGLAAIAGILSLNAQPKKAALVALPLCTVLPLIKTSGLFFACAAIALACGFCFRESKKNGFQTLLVLVAGLGVALLVWRLHLSLVFGGDGGKHAIDGGAYAASFGQKLHSGVLWQCTKNFLKRLADPWAVQNQLLGGMLLCLGLLWLAGPNGKAARNMLLLVLCLWALWQLGILGMYAFSATDREALNLSGQQRYSLSMAVYLMGLCTLFLLWLLNASWEGRNKSLCALLCTLMALCPLWPLRGSLPYLWQGLNPSLRRANLERQLSIAKVPEGARYALYVDDYAEVSYVIYLGRYLLQSPNVAAADGDNYRQALPQALMECDYLIFADPNPQAREYAESLLEQEGTSVQIVDFPG